MKLNPLLNWQLSETSSSSNCADSIYFPDSLSFSLSIRPYHPLLLTGLSNYTLCPHRADVDKFFLVRLTLACPWEGVHGRTSLMSSFMLLQLCHTCLVILTCMVFYMGVQWANSCCFMNWCSQNLFRIAHRILTLFLYKFFFLRPCGASIQ